MNTASKAIMGTKPFTLALLAFAVTSCVALDIDNEIPVANAKVMLAGVEVAQKTGIATVRFEGSPVSVVLDGSGSTDKDGRIKSYEWMRTDVAAVDRFGAYVFPDPVPRFLPSTAPAAFAGDPGMVMSPAVTLDVGLHQYSLWVTDDDDEISPPATVTVKVTQYEPDMACMTAYNNTAKPNCEECLCSPNARMGCLEQFNLCSMNPDPALSARCMAVVNCAIAKGCSGAACYTATACMAEIDAAADGDVTACTTGDPMTLPCAASGVLSTCTASSCMAACL